MKVWVLKHKLCQLKILQQSIQQDPVICLYQSSNFDLKCTDWDIKAKISRIDLISIFKTGKD